MAVARVKQLVAETTPVALSSASRFALGVCTMYCGTALIVGAGN